VSKYTSLRKSTGIALQALRRNKLQTILTMVGMTIGVATVLTMIALGSGAQAAIQDQVRAAGMNVVVVTAGNYKMEQQWTSDGETEERAEVLPRLGKHSPVFQLASLEARTRLLRSFFQSDGNPVDQAEKEGQYKAGRGASDTLSLEDAIAIEQLSGVQNVSPGVVDNASAKFENASWFTRFHGEGDTLPSVRRAWIFPHGRFFTRKEVKDAAQVAVVGSIVSAKLFGTENPVGKDIVIRDRSFRVIGIVASSSWMVPASEGDDQFDAIYVPVTAGEAILSRKSLDRITVSTVSTGEVTRVSKAITALLRSRHKIGHEQPDDFLVASQAHKSLAKGGMRTDVARAVTGNVDNLDKVTLEQLGKTLDRASRTMTALLASIATVSLVVGGIGIMNIMLLSVTERTREIGTRRAVGARSVDVMHQFLMEAIVLSLSGGLLGIIAGIAIAGSITKFVQWSTSISPLAVALSFGVSAGVGVLFGYYPAREASKVDPMTSLRYE
jgi:putative ABC transport system permease protein